MSFVRQLYLWFSLPLSLVTGVLFAFHPRGRRNLGERFGRWEIPSSWLEREANGEIVWFHAASLGEAKGLAPVLRAIRDIRPDSKILGTATSPSALPVFDEYVDQSCLLPFDSPIWIQRALGNLSIRLLVVSEVELWPTLFGFMARRGVPILMVNSRISMQSFHRFRKLRTLFGDVVLIPLKYLCADRASAERFEWLGVPPKAVRVVGNSKYDSPPSVSTEDQREALRSKFFAEELPVLVLGSIWPGEEEVWFPALRSEERLQVVVAPRHEEKFGYFERKLQEANLSFVKYSECQGKDFSPDSGNRIVLLDTLGQLEGVYSFATAAFVGGTIRKIGGHNPLEAAAYGACIAMGPHRETVFDVAEELKENSALMEVRQTVDARRLIELMFSKPEVVASFGERAQAVWSRNSGATGRILEEIEAILDRSRVSDQSAHV